MRFGFRTRLQGVSWADLVAVWRAADEMPVFESGWTYDHFFALTAGPEGIALDRNSGAFEGWSTLTAMGVVTRRLRIGNLVTGMHFRHPAVLAKMASTLDVISAGRLELGLGAGWIEEEGEMLGIPLGSPRDRMDRLEEGIQVLRSLMVDDRTTFHGRFYRLVGASSFPHPVQVPHPPIWIGGNGERRTLPIVAQYAQAWNYTSVRPNSHLDDFRRKVEVLSDCCDKIGRDPASILVSTQLSLGPAGPGRLAEDVLRWTEAGAAFVIVLLPLPHHPGQVVELGEALSALPA